MVFSEKSPIQPAQSRKQKNALPFHWLGRISYESGLAIQEEKLQEALMGKECVLLLEHEPVYTIGRTRDQSSLRKPGDLPHPVYETNRGGQATYHGPGQLVGYPILNLGQRGRDIHLYLRCLEEVLIRACAEMGVSAHRKESLTGVWVADRKLASLGVGLRKWISMHGFAINVCNDLEAFSHITPCGIHGVQMTSLSQEAGRLVSLEEFANVVEAIFPETLEMLPSSSPVAEGRE
jgi:lipoyl(octanoyl) transferase